MGRTANITLIGMPGCGKTTLGRLLAHKLGFQFVDADEIIESSGRKLQEIIEKEGEQEFLRIEEAGVLFLGGERTVFAPGGSCVLSSAAGRHLRSISLVVFLDVSLEVLQRRLSPEKRKSRGIVGMRSMDLERLFAFRRPLYLQYAHLVVRLQDESITESAEILWKRIEAAFEDAGGRSPHIFAGHRVNPEVTVESREELVTIVDEHNNMVGVLPRREMRSRRLLHRASYILVFDARGRLCVQRRTMTKDVFPGHYDVAAGGVVLAGETYEQAALRELAEELGINDAVLRQLFDFYYEDEHIRVWGRAYSCVYDGEVVLQEEEVESVQFLEIEEVLRLAAQEAFTPDSLYLLRNYAF